MALMIELCLDCLRVPLTALLKVGSMAEKKDDLMVLPKDRL